MKLTYFDAYGRAESLRLLLNYAGIEYEDERIAFKDWPAIKKDTSRFEYGQMPTLTKGGKIYCQSDSILRYLGREYGLFFPVSSSPL